MSNVDFVPPSDVKAFWLAPHCGPGTLDPNEFCGFCGNTHQKCAEQLSDKIEKFPFRNFDGCILGKPSDDTEDGTCGGSGFWCKNCGRFWAQNSCGDNCGGDYQAADGAKLNEVGGKVYCVCGWQLMTKRPEEDWLD